MCKFIYSHMHQQLLTLLPYTTLFRSVEAFERHHAEEADADLLDAGDRGIESDERAELRLEPEQRLRFRHELVRQLLQQRQDRKSTRLNSSHRCISYDVFCLKNTKISV